MSIRTVGLALLVCSIPFAAVGRAAEEKSRLGRFEFESKHMGVVFRIVLYAPDKATAEAASKAAFARVAELEKVMSDYDPNSEVMKLCKANDADPGKPRPVSDDLLDVLVASESVSGAADGSFDVTVGPVVQLWRLARRTQQLPDRKELAAALAKVGMDKLAVDPVKKTVTLKVPGMRLDFGGIGKGFAADAALAVLRKHGVTRALVAASGDVTVGGPPPGKDGWVVDVAPIGKGEPARTLKLANRSVSTSGDLYQFVEIGGVRYSHLVDPKTGLGLTGRRSVTVVAPKGVLADALTKAFSLLPPDKALALAEKDDLAFYMVVKETDDAEAKVTQSKNFEKYVASGK